MARTLLRGLALIAVLTGCTSLQPGQPATPAPSPALAGTAWTVQLIGGRATIPPAPTLLVEGSRVSGTASCNSYSGTLHQQGSTIRIEALAVTGMACLDAAVSQQESDFLQAMDAVASVRTAGERTELLDAAGAVLLTLAATPPVPDKPLQETLWVFAGTITGDVASSPVADTRITLTFGPGTIQGKACNTFRGSATVQGQGLTVGPLASTRMACPTQAESDQENHLLSALQASTSYAISGDQLTLSGPDGSLMFTASAGGPTP